ncbi:hypothetical protein [Embleya sp. NBC_00896]|uniref:hypothetical protein n=1 Tax=Embleya sp. NBC_00896 TaxID=2975961 RepID=UPI00386ED63D|nr:hypothetical protein OG928_25490 [Embleya sp. NBC_00896]
MSDMPTAADGATAPDGASTTGPAKPETEQRAEADRRSEGESTEAAEPASAPLVKPEPAGPVEPAEPEPVTSAAATDTDTTPPAAPAEPAAPAAPAEPTESAESPEPAEPADHPELGPEAPDLPRTPEMPATPPWFPPPPTAAIPTGVGAYGPLPYFPSPDGQRRAERRRIRAVVGGIIAIVALLAALGGAGVFDGSSARDLAGSEAGRDEPDPGEKTADKPPVTRIAVADVAFMTDNRTQALKSGDADAFVAGIDPAAEELVAAQRRLFANLRLFPFTSAEFRPPTTFIDPAEDGGPLTRDVNVVFAHQVAGVDSEPVSERYTWTLSRASVDAPLLITKIVGGSTRGGGNAYPASWDEGELALIERPHVLLAVPVKNKAKAAAWADRAESALKKNLAVWKGPAITPQRYVIYVTPDRETFTRALSGSDLPNVTGVCRTLPPARPSGPDQPMAGSRITLDGSDTMFTRGDSEQQTHLIRHELGHAMVAEFERGNDGAPLWVSEGFAEYLAWTDFSLAQWYQPDARKQVNAGKFGGKLPTDADINSADGKTSSINYHYSMLTIRYIAEKYSVAKADNFVVAVYKDSSPTAVDAAIKEATGLDRDTFEANWAKYVKAKVGG